MAAWIARMEARLEMAARHPWRRASAAAARKGRSGLKGFAAPAGLLRVGIGDAEARAGQAVLVIDDGPGQVDEAAVLDEQAHPVVDEFLVARFPRRNLHGIRHAGTTAGLNVNPQALVLG